MSEWKNKLDNDTIDTYYNKISCTGWGIIDGVINSIRSLKNRYRKNKQAKIKSKNLKE